MTAARAAMKIKSCLADALARSRSLHPIYCPHTTAPPVARAANPKNTSVLTESTRDTADTAASPTLATMIESARPTVIARNCSMIKGRISR